jgi:CRISPR-associated protein Cas1
VGKVVYVTEQGATIRRAGGRLLVTKESEVLLAVPISSIANVVIFGQAQVTTQAAHGLLDAGADVAFLTRSGRLKGLLSAGLSKNAVIRLAQYKRFSEASFRLGIARAIVAGKIRNQRVMVSRYCRRRQPPDEAAAGVAGAAATGVATADLSAVATVDLSAVLTSLDRGLAEAERAETPGALLGIEGSCTRAYFTAFGRMLREDFPWTGRSRRPPKDPPNALLSLGYVLVTNEVSCILSALSLDPYVGFFHGLRYGRASLALDLVEEFRHGLVDALTLDVLNRRHVTAGDFTIAEDGAVLLAPEALRRYLTLYETRLGSAITDMSGEATTWRGLVHQQAEAMRQAILRGSEYRPFVEE